MTTSGLVILTATATGLILVIGLLFRRHSARKQRVDRLLRSGVQTDEEYFWLFPEACRNCGSRTFIEVETSALVANTPGLSPDQVTWAEFMCGRCAPPESNDVFGYSTVRHTGASRTVYSRWLTRAQEEKIPQARPERIGSRDS